MQRIKALAANPALQSRIDRFAPVLLCAALYMGGYILISGYMPRIYPTQHNWGVSGFIHGLFGILNFPLSLIDSRMAFVQSPNDGFGYYCGFGLGVIVFLFLAICLVVRMFKKR